MGRRSFITSCDGSLLGKWVINVPTWTASSHCSQNHSKFSLDEAHRQLFYLPCLNTGSMRCGIFVAADFVIKNGSQLEAIAALAPEVKHQVSLFQISCCSSCFGQVPPFITITSQNGQNVVLCYGVGNVKYAVLCRGTCKKNFSVPALLVLHPPEQYLHQFWNQYWQIPCL